MRACISCANFYGNRFDLMKSPKIGYNIWLCDWYEFDIIDIYQI